MSTKHLFSKDAVLALTHFQTMVRQTNSYKCKRIKETNEKNKT